MQSIQRSPFDFWHVAKAGSPILATTEKKPVEIQVILHESIRLTQSQNDRMQKNFNLIQSEFKKHAGHEVKFNLDHYSHLRGFSKGGDKLSDLNSQVDYLKRQQKQQPTDNSERLKKYLFITPKIENGRPGAGAPGLDAGIAALNDDRGIAYAVGLMFGAKPGDAEVNYHFPWWYETVMNNSGVSSLHANDYRFSDKNRKNIRTYLNKFS
jgi:hypothetical protein